MRGTIIFSASALVASADVTPFNLQKTVDGLFDAYLPQKATWEDVKACRAQCGEHDADCLAKCPEYKCPFKRISEKCDLFEEAMSSTKECHHTCESLATKCPVAKMKCHFKCPMARPTSVKELQDVGEAMLCHTRCGKDRECHKTACPKPWKERQERCDKLLAVVSCFHNGGSHSTCPHLDNATKTKLLEEPDNLVTDVAEHIVDHFLPLPAGQEATLEEVKACHMNCGYDSACHKACPTGSWGILKDQCNTLDAASECHHTCESLATKCPVAKMKCHFKCPMSMPTSVQELKGVADHVACHVTCKDKVCHGSCPNSVWDQKKAQCLAYKQVMACHQGCGRVRDCHMGCPHLDTEAMSKVSKEPTSLVNEVISTIVV
jgi:hypothetical protein